MMGNSYTNGSTDRQREWTPPSSPSVPLSFQWLEFRMTDNNCVSRTLLSKPMLIADLSECQLMSFPDAVYHLMRNTVLLTCDLSSNVFRKIPSQLPIKFVNITELNLSNNRLSSLPEEIKDMKELQKLDLSHNDFMMLPRVAFKIPHLVYLNLKKNFIVDIDVSKIRSAPALRELNLEDNPLTKTAFIQLQSIPSSRLLIHVTVPKPEDDSDDDFDFTPPNSSV